MHLISVIIPVKNGERTLEKCLSAIRNQTIAQDIEIVVLDSCSTDNSVAIAKKFDALVINIPNGTFNHGLTRNLGKQYASAPLLYFTVQDASLAQDEQLGKMAGHFSDEQLMAVTGMQGVEQDINKNPAVWFKRFSKPEPVFKYFPAGEYEKLPSYEQFRLIGEWDDVNTMYRKKALEQIPFIETDFAEDKFWARDALKAGLKICFDPSFIVYHYHHASFRYTFALEYIINYNYYSHFKIYPKLPLFFKPLLHSIYQVWKKKNLGLGNKIYWSFHNASRLSAFALSNIIFLGVVKLFGEKALKKSFYFFCKKVPQGKSK